MSWDQMYVDQDTPWDQGAPSALVLDLASALDPGRRLLVPGCGRGHEVEALAARGHHVVGLDLSPTALAQAAARVGPHPRIEWAAADLFALPDDWAGRFDAVIEHTCYCAIDPDQRDAYVRAMHRVLRPGGALLGAFLQVEGDGPPHGTDPDEIRARFSDHFEVERLTPAAPFGPQAFPQLAVWLRASPRPA